VAGAYLLLTALAWHEGGARADWIWLVAFFAIFTLGELFILPTGLGVFARLAPPAFAATTVACWFLTIFSGSLSAGLVGILWSRIDHTTFFLLLTVLAALAALMLRLLDAPMQRAQRAERQPDRLEAELS
jgi:POT family proton-dependent oligopeptide transporter